MQTAARDNRERTHTKGPWSLFEYDVPWSHAEFAPAAVGVEGNPASEPHGLEAGPVPAERGGEQNTCFVSNSVEV